MKIVKEPSVSDLTSCFTRPSAESVQSQVVDAVFEQIQKEGDKAIQQFTQKFDGILLDDFRINPRQLEEQARFVGEDLKKAIRTAMVNIRTFHAAQQVSYPKVETVPGVTCWLEARPIDRVGLYIPGGSAPLFSTLCMLVVPAQVAGVSDIVVCTPPNREGKLDPAMAWILQELGVKQVYLVGGMQAIAAMAVGTETIPKVDKIFGPGNRFVEAAKNKATTYGTAIDLPAGPSEALVLVDNRSNPVFVAADLLAQAEHDPFAQVGVVALSEQWGEKLKVELEQQLVALPRKAIAEKSLENGWILIAENTDEMVRWSNNYGPEHLLIQLENPQEVLPKITNAGSVFVGELTPESLGDYASGTNHTLPTSGWTKSYSGINLMSFQKLISFQECSSKGLANLGPAVSIMARGEGLDGHAEAVEKRLKWRS